MGIASTPIPICPPEHAQYQIGAAPAYYKLPIIERFCRRGRLYCGAADDILHSYFEGAYKNGTNPVIQLEADQGLGFGAALQGKAQHLLLGLATGRPAHVWMRARVFNRGGNLLAPHAVASPYIDNLPQSVGYESRRSCERALASAVSGAVLPSVRYQCVAYTRSSSDSNDGNSDDGNNDDGNSGDDGNDGNGRNGSAWLPLLDQTWVRGVSWAKQQSSWWDWRRSRVTRAIQISALFPNGTTLAIDKLGALRYMIGKLVLAHGARGAGSARAGQPGWSVRGLEQLTHSPHDLAGPGCLVRHLVARAAPPVLRAVADSLGEAATSGGGDSSSDGGAQLQPLVVGLHIRRGDRAIHGECRACVNPDEQDVHGSDRIPLGAVQLRLLRVNETLARLRAAACRPIKVFLASDTAFAARLARRTLAGSGASVVDIHGLAVVSSNTHVTRSSAKYQRDSIKVAGDFLALAISDVIISVGDSAFSSNAAAMGFGIALLEDDLDAPLQTENLARLRATFAGPAPATCA